MYRILQSKIRLVILDDMLQSKSDFDVCKVIRTLNPLQSIIMLTSETDQTLGLGLCADNYMTKSFSIRELEAKISPQL